MRKLMMIAVALLLTGVGTVIAAPQSAREMQSQTETQSSEIELQDGGGHDEPCSTQCLPEGLRREKCYIGEDDACSRCFVRPDTSCRIAPQEHDADSKAN